MHHNRAGQFAAAVDKMPGSGMRKPDFPLGVLQLSVSLTLDQPLWQCYMRPPQQQSIPKHTHIRYTQRIRPHQEMVVVGPSHRNPGCYFGARPLWSPPEAYDANTQRGLEYSVKRSLARWNSY